MARALLGNGPVNTPLPDTHKATMEDVSQGRNVIAPMKTLAKNHMICSLCGLPYATRELGFLCVVRAEAV
jgi:hypothetical protein